MIVLAGLLFFQAVASKPAINRPAPSQSFAVLSAKAEEAKQQKQFDEAAGLYRQALRLKPDWKEGWWSLGSLLYQRDQFPPCRDAYRQLTLLEPKGGPAWTMLGLCEFGAGSYRDAGTHLQQGQDLGVADPSIDTVAKYHLAQVCTKIGAFERALALMLPLVQKHERGTTDELLLAGLASLQRPMLLSEILPSDRELIYLAGKAFWELAARRPEQAQKNLDALAAKYPEASGVHYLYGTYYLQTDPDKAVAEFQKELAISPRHVAARTALAFEYLRRGEPAKGLPYAQEAVALFPDAMAPHALLGRILAESGDAQQGVKELELAVKLAPEDPQPRIALASAYAKLGRSGDAARERQEFQRLQKLQEGAKAQP